MIVATLVPLQVVVFALVALEAVGAVATLVLLCLSVGLGQSTFFTLPVIAAVTSWIGSLVFARFLGRWT